MIKTNIFNFNITERNLENTALPPDDPLEELSKFELGLRRFCYELDRKVVVEVGDQKFTVFFDPDICMLLEDQFPEKIKELEQGKTIYIDFVESNNITVVLQPQFDTLICKLKKFDFEDEEKIYELDKEQVLKELKRFLLSVMELAIHENYVSLEDLLSFMAPAFFDKKPTNEYFLINKNCEKAISNDLKFKARILRDTFLPTPNLSYWRRSNSYKNTYNIKLLGQEDCKQSRYRALISPFLENCRVLGMEIDD